MYVDMSYMFIHRQQTHGVITRQNSFVYGLISILFPACNS